MHRLYAMSHRRGCPGVQTAMLAAALQCYADGRYACALALADRVTQARLKPVAMLFQARAAFRLGKLNTGLKYVNNLLKQPVLHGPAIVLRLKLLCRMGQCNEGIRETLPELKNMDAANRFRIRSMLVQAFAESGQVQRALRLAEFLFFNSIKQQEKGAMYALKILNPLVAHRDKLLKAMFESKHVARFVRRHYYTLKKLPIAWAAASQIRGQDPLQDHWAVRWAGVMDAQRHDRGREELLNLLNRTRWFPYMPVALDNLCTRYCDSLTPGIAAKIMKSIPIETGYRPIARFKIGMCLLRQGRAASGFLTVPDDSSRRPGLVFDLDESVLSLSALAAMRQHRMDDAIRAWKRLARGYPYTFLAVLARSRLQQAGYKTLRVHKDRFIRALSDFGLTGLDLVRMGRSTAAIEFLLSIRATGMLRPADTQVLSYLLHRHWGLRAGLAQYLRGRPYRSTRVLFHMAWPRAYQRLIGIASRRTGVPVALITATARAESRFRAWAISKSRAYGLMQVQRHTARVIASRVLKRPGMARSLFFPINNLLIGAHYLRLLTEHFNGCLSLALVAYNAGISRAHQEFMANKGVPTELFVLGLRPKLVRFYVSQILSMAPTYGFLYHTAVPGILLNIPKTLKPFSVRLSLKP